MLGYRYKSRIIGSSLTKKLKLFDALKKGFENFKSLF
jgi:hypothetical protein